MITTEAEARKKICIDVRVRASTEPGASAGYNRTRLRVKQLAKEKLIERFFPGYYHLTRGRYFRCTASGCMAWRWADSERGYCGRAGPPQAGHGAPPPPVRESAETRQPGEGSRGGDGVLVTATAAAVAILVWAALNMMPPH
jgi:hypothetical protein